ncbi:MAG: tetratricopeptide repeat protein [Candidatus Aminicenantes bacterium]
MKKQMPGTAAALLLTMFTFTWWGWAQEGRGKGRLTGEVRDEDKNPIAGVNVTLDYLSYDYQLTDVTDKNGKWAFVGLGMGVVKITAEKDGFIPGGIQVSVSSVNRNPRQLIILKHVEDIKPGTAEAGDMSRDTFVKATALYKESKYEAALALFQDFRQHQPQLYQIGINIGNCYLELGRFEEAIKEFQAVADKITAENSEVKGNAELARLYASIGDTYMRQNKLKAAEEYFKKSIEIDSSDHALAYNVAEILFAGGKTEDAIKYYQLAIRIKPDWPKSYVQLGYAYLNKGDTKAAIESLKKFVELAPDSPQTPGVKDIIKSLE